MEKSRREENELKARGHASHARYEPFRSIPPMWIAILGYNAVSSMTGTVWSDKNVVGPKALEWAYL